MNIITELYAPFFDKANWVEFFSSSSSWMLLATLIIMECLLSVDNAVVLAAQTKTLDDEKDRRKALTYGLWGAYIFRFIAIGLGTYLINLWQIKVLGALYLVYLAYAHFFKPNKEVEIKEGDAERSFWKTVLSIELMDIAFSVDAVLASLAVADNPVVILIGGFVGILAMRGIANIIARWMDKIPELEGMAYFLIFFIGIKLFLSIPSIGIEIPASAFAVVVALSFIVTIAINKYNVKKRVSN
ncbi:TerC family protein [Vagococcus coleopterorum]|uniref:TerC family protein n=1 Tax=Vagococcus coleopterorum TaxID=2714946 RepID=A0A6G8ANC7_9ENTE|nr:TerC family protein [Vagococcus coleopterorum]QIL46584.1 TerC family protein [Vagococcus coleopterorum]